MKLRQVRLGLWSATILVAALAVLVCLWGIRPPALGQQGNNTKSAKVSPAPATSPVPPLASFAPLLSLDLRQPLEDKVAVQAPLAIKLTGTILEPGRNIAMFQKSDGSVELAAVGEKTAGAEVLEILESSAVIFYQGQKMTLKIEARP